jgi:hypothetical protein
MKRKHVIGIFVIVMVALTAAVGSAEVETQVYKTIRLDASPIDMAMAANGKYIYTLTDAGTVEIYSGDGRLLDTVTVGSTVDQIEAGPREDILLLKSRTDRTVQILSVEFVQQIDISGAPIKGPETATVAVVVFSDFQ